MEGGASPKEMFRHCEYQNQLFCTGSHLEIWLTERTHFFPGTLGPTLEMTLGTLGTLEMALGTLELVPGAA